MKSEKTIFEGSVCKGENSDAVMFELVQKLIDLTDIAIKDHLETEKKERNTVLILEP